MVHHGFARRLQGCLAQEPLGRMVEAVGRHPLDAAAHRGDAQVGAVRDQRGKQGLIAVLAPARLIAAQRRQRAGINPIQRSTWRSMSLMSGEPPGSARTCGRLAPTTLRSLRTAGVIGSASAWRSRSSPS